MYLQVEGVGGTWVPMVLDASLVDHVEVVTDQESFLTARELSRKEGLLCGKDLLLSQNQSRLILLLVM